MRARLNVICLFFSLRFAIEIQPTGEISEYTATITSETLRDGKKGRHKVETLKLTLKAEGITTKHDFDWFDACTVNMYWPANNQSILSLSHTIDRCRYYKKDILKTIALDKNVSEHGLGFHDIVPVR